MKKTNLLIISLCLLLITSVFFNIKPDSNRLWHIRQANANTRPTYNTFHNITGAQQLAKGKGVKVGIIDKYFGFAEHRPMYAGGMDFTGNQNDFEAIGEHGLWMATTLKEIAPDAEIFALNARTHDKAKEKDAIIAAIKWAIKNKIEILTYAAEPFVMDYRKEIDSAIRDAINNNITIVFLHYDLPENILPFAFSPDSLCPYSRMADLNIYHFDYNLLLIEKYQNYMTAGSKVQGNHEEPPFLSFSSMPQVIAGVVAMMKETNPGLTPRQIKQLLIESATEITTDGFSLKRVMDAENAVYMAMNEEAVL